MRFLQHIILDFAYILRLSGYNSLRMFLLELLDSRILLCVHDKSSKQNVKFLSLLYAYKYEININAGFS